MRLSFVSLLALSFVAACATRGSEFPVLSRTMSSDATADCAALASELERVAVLRREIAREQNVAGASDVASVLVSTAVNPLGGLIEGALTAAGAEMRNTRYDRAADAADQRIETLLSLRGARECERSDAELALVDAFADQRAGEGRAREAREEAIATFLPPPAR
jgi:hypothetical protein